MCDIRITTERSVEFGLVRQKAKLNRPIDSVKRTATDVICEQTILRQTEKYVKCHVSLKNC